MAEAGVCTCINPLILSDVADTSPLELEWGTQKPRTAASEIALVVAEVPEASPAVEQALDPVPDMPFVSYVPKASAGAFLEFAAKVTGFVLTAGVLLELLSAALAIVGLVLAQIKVGDYGHDFMPAGSRVSAWGFSVTALAIWTFGVLRAREQRGGRPAAEEFQTLLLTPVSPKSGIAVFNDFFPDPRRGALAFALQTAAAIAAICSLLLVPRMPHGNAAFVTQALVALTICAAMVTTRAVVFEVMEYEGARAEELPAPVVAAPVVVAPRVVAPPVSAPAPRMAPPAPRVAPPAPLRSPAPPVRRPAAAPPAAPIEKKGPAEPSAAEAPKPVEKCLHCGAAIDAKGADCPECRAPQLFDVVLIQAVTDARAIHTAAMAVGKLGHPAPTFSEARQRLSASVGALVSGAPQAIALQTIEILKRSSIAARMVRVRGSRARLPKVPTAIAAGVVLALVAASWLWQRRTLSAEELAARAKPSIVTVTCKDWLGTGFFIAPDLVLTNEHVACRDGERPELKFSDGHKLEGKVRGADDLLDLAIIEAPGANAKPLRLSDAGLVHEGAHVLMIGAPNGLDFSVHQALVSHIGRTALGISYLQFDGNVNHGNSGGPLLDDHGQVIGVVTQRFERMQGIGLALPVNYLAEASLVHGSEVTLPRASSEWARLKEAAATAELDEVTSAQQELAHPTLMDYGASNGKVAVTVAIRSAATPGPLYLTARTLPGCDESLVVEKWEPLTVAGERVPQRVRWLNNHKLIDGMYGGVGILASRCQGSQVVILDGSRELARMPTGAR